MVDQQGALKDRIRMLEDDVSDRGKEVLDRDTLFKKKEKEFLKQNNELKRAMTLMKKQLDVAESNNRKDMEQKLEINTKNHKDLQMSYRNLDHSQKKIKDEFEKEILLIT